MARPKSIAPVIVAENYSWAGASILAVTSPEFTITLPGARPGYRVNLWAESLEANLALGHAYCSALNTIKFRVINPTAGTIVAAAQVLKIVQR
jgi:hypothetical protein